MSLASDVLLGVQHPQIVHPPPDVVSLDAATEAIELADAYGICDGHPLDESQKFTLRLALGERADGSWAASAVGDFEPRQNGKNDTCNARELAGLILFGERLQIHTAHEFATANESFLRLVGVFENWDDLRRRVARIRYANGEQGIELLSGQRLKYRARTGGSGRGFAKADLTVYDEAQHLQAEHVAASGPAKLANPNSVSWYMGSGGLSTSVNAWRLRLRALSGNGGRLAYVEHTAEDVSLDSNGNIVSHRPDVLDRHAWAMGNAAYGYRITDEKLLDLYDELGPEMFARECLNVWDPMPGVQGQLVIPIEVFMARHDPNSTPEGPVTFGVAASDDRQWACISAAARRTDGLHHVEVIDHRPGVDWLAPRAIELSRKWGGATVAVLPGSAAGSAVAALEAAMVKLEKVSGQAFGGYCGAFIDAFNGPSPTAFHREGPQNASRFRTALKSARLRTAGTVQVWACDPASDITALVAATLAFGVLPMAKIEGVPNVW